MNDSGPQPAIATRPLTLLNILLILTLVGAFLGLAGAVIYSVLIARGASWPAAAVSVDHESLGPAVDAPEGWITQGQGTATGITVAPEQGSLPLALAHAFWTVPPVVLITVWLWMLFRLTSSTAILDDRGMFSVTTARTLRRIGWIAAIGGLATYAYNVAMHNVVDAFLLPDGLSPTAPLSGMGFGLGMTGLIVGAGLMVVATVVLRGTRMREDLEGTV